MSDTLAIIGAFILLALVLWFGCFWAILNFSVTDADKAPLLAALIALPSAYGFLKVRAIRKVASWFAGWWP